MKTTLTVEVDEKSVKVHGDGLPQRQDSLTDQMRDLIPMANKMGCYDVADYLRRMVEDTTKNTANAGGIICLDELLTGNPTWEQVMEFWRDDRDFCGEQYLVAAIKRWLRTEAQRREMADMDVSVEEMLNGRYDGKFSDRVQAIYNEWNAKLGFKAFGG